MARDRYPANHFPPEPLSEARVDPRTGRPAGMSASSMAIGARPAPVAGAARARAPNARARSLTSASRVITTSKRRLARADTHVVFAAADSPTGEAGKEEVDKTTNEDGSVVYSFGDDVIARVDTKTSFDLPPVDEKDEKVEKDDTPVTTGEAPASNAVWKRKDEPAPAPPAATPPPPPPRVNPNAGPAAPKFNLTPKKASQPVADVQAKTSTPSPSPPPPASDAYDLEDAENARKVAKGAAILTAGTASVVALTLGVGGAALVEGLDKIPLLSGFEEAVGVAVSAYYANKFKGNFLTATGRESLRLNLVEKFTRATGLASLAGKLARTDPELDAQINGIIGDLDSLPEGGKELPEAVREAIAAFVRNRDGALLEETSALRTSNDALQREVDKIELLQNELEQARRETTFARANIRVMNVGEKERASLRAAADEAKKAGDAQVDALRQQMEQMAKDAAEKAAAAAAALESAKSEAEKAAAQTDTLAAAAEEERRREVAAALAEAERAAAERLARFESEADAKLGEAQEAAAAAAAEAEAKFAEELAAKLADALKAAEAEAAGDLAAATDKVQTMTKELESLKASYAEMEKGIEAKIAAAAEDARAEQEAAAALALEKAAKEAEAKLVEAQEKAAWAIEEERSRAEAAIKEMEANGADAAELEAKLEAARKQSDEATAAATRASKDAEAAKADAEAAKASLAKSESALAKSEAKTAELEKKITSADAVLAEAREETQKRKAEFDAALKDARATADATIVAVKSELADTQTELTSVKGAYQELERDVDMKIAFATDELEIKYEALEATANASERRAVDAELALADMTEKVDQLEYLLACADDEAAKTAERAQNAKANLEGDAEVGELKFQLDDVKARLAAAETSAKEADARAQTAAGELAAAEAKAGAVLEAADAAKEVEEASRRMTKRVSELETELKRAESVAKKAEARAERLAKKLNETIDKKEKTSVSKKAASGKKKKKEATGEEADFADEFIDDSVDVVKLPALSKMKKQELVDELAARGLDVAGTVPVLRARLREVRAASE